MGNGYRKKIKSILNTGTLSGFELAKICMFQINELEKISEPELFDLVPKDMARRIKAIHILSPEEIDVLKYKNLKGHNDKIKEFNNWMQALDSFLSIIYSAHILYLQIEKLLSFIITLLEENLIEIKRKNVFRDDPDLENWIWIKHSPWRIFIDIYLQVKYKAALFLLKKSLAKVLTEETGINYSEQIDRWHEKILLAIDSYNELFLEMKKTVGERSMESLNGLPGNIDLEELKIKAELEDKFRRGLIGTLEENTKEPLRMWVSLCNIDFHNESEKMSKIGIFSHSINLKKK